MPASTAYGFIEAPYRKVDKATGHVTDEVDYMTADVEDEYHRRAGQRAARHEDGCLVTTVSPAATATRSSTWTESSVDYMDVSPKMVCPSRPP